jgi:hypothetical protein
MIDNFIMECCIMAIPTGVVIYDGPSIFDGKRIVVIANGFKRNYNEKIGNMVRTWIIKPDIHIVEALQTGADYSICKDCKHRYAGMKSCYVNPLRGPMGVYHAYLGGSYVPCTENHLKLFENRTLRLGSYGDPAAVPIEVWRRYCIISSGYTGYTHHWNTCDQEFKYLCMASVDTIEEKEQAQAMGWRTFRVRKAEGELLEDEFVCPASNEAGHKTTCDKCCGCGGLGSKWTKNPVIVVHGQNYKVKNYNEKIELFPANQKLTV